MNTLKTNYMKKVVSKIIFTAVFLSLTVLVLGQQFSMPLLITSAGQSADVKLVKILAARESLDAKTVLLASDADLEGIKTLVIVPGFSSKGLGAAGISQEEELARVNNLIDLAVKKGIPIIMMHVGGSARRQGQSDAFNDLVAKHSKYMIVVAQGDEDQFFTRISKEKNIPMVTVDKIADSGKPLAALFK